MLFLPDNYEDISRYYKNTFVKFKETGERLFYIKTVNSEKVTGVTSDGTPFELYLSMDAPYEVDYILPHKSYFQHGDHACLLQRTPAKQYQRGISESNVSISALKSTGQDIPFTIGFEVLECFVSKQSFLSISQAIESVQVSVVLSPRFAYVPGTRKIYVDTILVAQIHPTKKLVNCYHKLFKPELTLLVKDSAYEVI